MKNTKILFIGGGNMALALISGLIADGIPPDNITVSEPDTEKRQQFETQLKINTTTNNEHGSVHADVILIAVKPQVAKAVCKAIAPALIQNKPLVMSIAAGISHKSMQKWIGEDIPLVRTMPNTPSMVQAGATGLYAGTNVSIEQQSIAEAIMDAVGITQWTTDESMIDAVTALSGSGPAYYFLFMEAMEAAAVKLGLTPETARLLTLQTALGAAHMAMNSDDSPAELRKKVTSPGGTTEQAINTFEQGELSKLVEDAMTAARDKSIELSTLLGAD